VFTDDCSERALDALFAMEPHILNSLYRLISLKPCMVIFGVMHDVEVSVVSLHGKSTIFGKTVRDTNLPVSLILIV
jgi:hypothetical protein